MAPMARRALSLAAILAMAVVVLLILRGSPASRTEALLLDLEDGVERGDGGLLADLVSPAYPVFDHWPQLEPFAPEEGDDRGRRAIARALTAGFMQGNGGQRDLEWTLRDLTPDPTTDGLWIAHIDVRLTVATGGGPGSRMPPLSNHRFVLEQRGMLLPAMYFRDHDPIALRP